ncbi:hypothetical protein ACTWQL_06445 [Pseudalkalibacillus sp. R45]|uniref:Nmad3 family putative nucleotide modification protein n=1 Tax=Pseudalkalibacillus sp. R45 TaxID=3457433 RepID=UPI003FCDC72B
MKIILSRKGFDSSAGGYPSPILPNGALLSLPIPDQDSSITYEDLIINETSFYKKMHTMKKTIKIGKKWSELNPQSCCHLDPDIDANVMTRTENWRGTFGQSGAAQKHLTNQGVEPGDVFLFFGWFRKTIQKENRIVFDPNDRNGRHIIYGYLQIEDIIRVNPTTRVPDWLNRHPHCTHLKRKSKGNTIYVAGQNLSWNKRLSGYGTFIYDKRLVLTKEGMTKSCWALPNCFKGVDISYHKPTSWKDQYFQSVARGQEFVIDCTDDIVQWTKKIIER